MATITILEKTFKDKDSGENISYNRLAIIGSINGETHTLEIKLEPTQLMLAKMLLASTEDFETQTHPATDEEKEQFGAGNIKVTDFDE